MQATLGRSLRFSGVGLHGGQPVNMTLRPGSPGSGIRFCRIDVADRDQIIPATVAHVVETRLCTKLGNADGVTISTVEHIMAALSSVGLDNVLIDVDGPEVPIMDGSAQPFITGIARVGLVLSPEPRRMLKILRRVTVAEGMSMAELRPAPGFTVDYTIDFPDKAIGKQHFKLDVDRTSFAHDLADCRTFARLGEIEALRRAGLARGGDLTNAVVVDGDRVLNPNGLRRADEFVRHKALDAVGDLALAGGPIQGSYSAERGGHEMTYRLLKAVFADRRAYRWVDVETHPASTQGTEAHRAARLAAE